MKKNGGKKSRATVPLRTYCTCLQYGWALDCGIIPVSRKSAESFRPAREFLLRTEVCDFRPVIVFL